MKNRLSARTRQTGIAWIIIAACYLVLWILPFVTEHSGQAFGTAKNLENLRNASNFKWYVIPMLGIVAFAYSVEMEKKNWAGVFGGLAFFLLDAFHELWNGLLFTATGKYSAYWMCDFPSAYQALIGWNIEIIFNFLFWGLIITKTIPKDKDKKFFGVINNRVFLAFVWGLLGVAIEFILNSFGALIWNYPWWSAKFPLLIIIVAYFPFALITFYVYDLPTVKHQARFVGIMGGILALCYIVSLSLGWI